MNGERLDATLRDLYHRTDTAPADVRRSVGAAMARVEKTPQRSRWWPLPARMHTTTATRDARDTRDTHATPVTGGTRSMFSTSKLIAVGATVAVTGGLYAAGMITPQQDSQPAVAPAAEAPDWATPVTGHRVGVDDVDSTQVEWFEGDGWNEIRGYKLMESYEWSDPRLPASVVTVVNLVEPADESWQGQVMHGSLLLEDTEGYWTGTETSFADAAEQGYGLGLLAGHGEYEGLSAVLRWTTDDPDCIECLTADGYIYEREAPPVPEPLEPTAE